MRSYFRFGERDLHKFNVPSVDSLPRWNGPGSGWPIIISKCQLDSTKRMKDNKKPQRNENRRWTPSSNGINSKKLLKNRRSNCHRTNDLYFCFSYLCFINYRMYLFTILILLRLPLSMVSMGLKTDAATWSACRSRFYLNGTHQRSFGGSVTSSPSMLELRFPPFVFFPYSVLKRVYTLNDQRVLT